MSDNEGQRSSLIEIDIDAEIQNIIGRLDSLTNRLGAAKILKDALDTATAHLRKEMITAVKERYTFRRKSELSKESRVQKAGGANLQAAVVVKGSIREIKEFKTRKNSSGAAAMGQVLRSGTMKRLEHNGVKAFIATFRNSETDEQKNHTTIVRRVPGEEYSVGRSNRLDQYGSKIDMTKIMPIYSPSIPHMMGSQAVQERAQANAYDILQAEITKHIDNVLGQNGRR